DFVTDETRVSRRAAEIVGDAIARVAVLRAPIGAPAAAPARASADPLDGLDLRVDALRRHLWGVAQALERLSQEVAHLRGEVHVVSPPSSEPPAEPEAWILEEPPAPQVVDAPHLAAIEMAISERSREDTAEHISETYGIDDPAPILDEVFGPAGGA
ncbi:MAG: hypothetical protein QOE60_2353, partial [Thermoleophilaceae bacterium]|nr:hypothetical protein [Thermoleophilaceae bacterium]